MSADLVSIRMLCVAATRADRELWLQGAGQAPVPIDFDAVDAALAATKIGLGGVDICVVDMRLPDADMNRVVAAARKAQPKPFIVASAPRGTRRVDGIDGMLPRPASADDARKLVEICVRVKIPTRVLIVDDSGTTRGIVRKILSANRFALEIHEAGEGIDGLERMRGGKFGIVFLDYDMPCFNGFEAMAEIKRESPNVAVVMMAAAVDNVDADRVRKAGALAFLKKPFYPAEVNAVLERHFGMPSSLR